MGIHKQQVERLLDLDHTSRIEQLELAFRVIGKQLINDIRDAVWTLPPDSMEDNGAGVPPSKKSAWGLPAAFGPGPTSEEIDENRRKMFCGSGELP
jgi:hypothetical protein